jgi:hypothetical protein
MDESILEMRSDAAPDGGMPIKIAIVLREDLEPWQRLNVAAFTISGVASQDGAVGDPYRDDKGSMAYPAPVPQGNVSTTTVP